MANYYTEASFQFKLSDKHKQFALDVLDCFDDDDIDFTKRHKSKAAKKYPSDVFRAAKALHRRFQDPEYPEDIPYLGFKFEEQEHGLWIYYEETINTMHAAYFVHLVMKHCDIEGYVAFEAAYTCSKPRTDAFGGHAWFITKSKCEFMDTYSWIHRRARRSGLQPAA